MQKWSYLYGIALPQKSSANSCYSVLMETKSTAWFSLHLFLIPFFFVSSLNISLSTAITDTITKGQSLSGNQTLVSKGGDFELGFFTPAGNSHNYYIGIWYKNIPEQTIIWVANRESPISNPSSSTLTISESGDLVLLNDASNHSVWSTNATSSTSAVLLDSGNLVLINGSNTNSYIWQSFDHPTDTLMSGGRLSFNKITGEYNRLTSWKNKEDPAPGLFEECMDPNGSSQFFLLWNGSKIYWQSGLWDEQAFNMLPGSSTHKSFINFTFVEDNETKYIIYTIIEKSVISRWVLEPSGQGLQWLWVSSSQQWTTIFSFPVDSCDSYSLCGPFGVCDQTSLNLCGCPDGFQPTNVRDWGLNDWSSGCERKTKLQCGDKDGFLRMSNVRLPTDPRNLKVGSENECKIACSNNCSCIAYAYDSSDGCSIWNGELRNIRQLHDGDSGGGILFLRLLASDIPKSSSSHKMTLVVIFSIVVGFVAISSLVCGLIWACRRRKQIPATKQVDNSLISFSYSELQRITKNFSEKLGSGGFGSVFKGVMPNSTVVAVKMIEGLRQGEKQFRAEVSTLGVIQHVNLVRLCGFCSEGSKRLVVYEYMSGGSLDSHLFHDGPTVLDWKRRYQIVLGTARGLAYLHEKCRECVIHCDIKPDNILLDDNFIPKVADFGMAKLVGRDFSRVLTTMRGTLGYLALEWISGQPITPKVDVYSFGMTLLEIVSGKRNTKHSVDGGKEFYPNWAAKKVVEGDTVSLVDKRLEGAVAMDEVSKVCKLAIWCIQDKEEHRPSMGHVVQILEGGLEVNTPPIPQSLQNLSTESGIGSSSAFGQCQDSISESQESTNIIPLV